MADGVMGRLFSVFDMRAEVHGAPFMAPNKGVAIRMFTELVRDPQSMVSKYPGDFKLVELAAIDLSTGSISVLSSPVSLGFGSDYVIPVKG